MANILYHIHIVTVSIIPPTVYVVPYFW